LPRWWNW